ncbi:MAG: lysylphosphatidylglycerol synthase transmembrane domain-containing protein, partial [Anaerolineaceae bacterium]
MHQDRKAVVSGVLRWLVPLLISAVAVIFLSQKVDLRAVGQAFQKISLNTILLIVLLYFSGHLLRVLCWYVILDGKFPFKMVFYGMSAGYLLNNVLPLRLGEFGRALLLSGKGKDHAGFMEVFASIITERMLDVFLAAFFFLLTLSLIVGQNSLRVAAIVIFILIVVIMVAAAIAAAHKEKILASLETRWADKPKRLEKALPKIEEFLTGFRFLLKPKQLILALALLASSWAFCIGEFTVLQQELLSSSRWWWGAFVALAGA